eukprot:912152-Prorocentrum_minimum.AAC.5
MTTVPWSPAKSFVSTPTFDRKWYQRVVCLVPLRRCFGMLAPPRMVSSSLNLHRRPAHPAVVDRWQTKAQARGRPRATSPLGAAPE